MRAPRHLCYVPLLALALAAPACGSTDDAAPTDSADSGADDGFSDSAETGAIDGPTDSVDSGPDEFPPLPPLDVADLPTQTTQRASMHTARDGHTATLLADGRVVVIGGEMLFMARPMLDSVEVYDRDTDTWTELAPLPESRCNHTATLLDDGRILVVGGGKMNGIGVPSGLEVRTGALLYDPATGASESLGPNLVPRHGHQAARLRSGKVLLVGGADDQSTVKPSQGNTNPQPFGNALASAEVFDPATRTFTAVGSLAEARYAFAAIMLSDGRYLVSGGASYEQEARSLATSEVFDETTGTFAPAGTFDGSDRLFPTGTRLSDGRAFVFGGKKSNITFLDDVQVFDPVTATWTAGGNLPPTRTVSMSVPTADGGALVIGGLSCTFGGCSTSPNVDVWHADGTVTAGPALLQDRALGTATVLNEGTVLVVGGYATAGLDSVELLTP